MMHSITKKGSFCNNLNILNILFFALHIPALSNHCGPVLSLLDK